MKCFYRVLLALRAVYARRRKWCNVFRFTREAHVICAGASLKKSNLAAAFFMAEYARSGTTPRNLCAAFARYKLHRPDRSFIR